MLEILLYRDGIAIDVETSSPSGKKKDNLHFMKCSVVCVGFAYEEGDKIHSFSMSKEEIDKELPTFIEILKTKHLMAHNIKFDAKVLAHAYGVPELNLYWDTMIAAKIIDENEKAGLKSLALKYFKADWGEWCSYKDYLKERYPEDKLKDTKLKIADNLDYEIYLTALKKYCAMDAEMCFKLAIKFREELKRQKLEDLFSLEMESVRVFYKAELNGVNINIPFLETLYIEYKKRVDKKEALIFERVRRVSAEYVATLERDGLPPEEIITEFNISSPKQLSHVLFDVFGLPVLKSSEKTKNPSTDVWTLTELGRSGHKIVKRILNYRHWEMLRRHIDKLLTENIGGKIYPTFNTIGTETGRFSCSEPNLQQIPSKSAAGLKIRQAFYGDLIVVDYSNVELRLLAHYTRDPKLLKVYSPEGSGDLHREFAAVLFRKKFDEVTKAERSKAKTINFGISYGMGPRKLSESLGVEYEMAKEYIDTWYNTYSLVKPWKDMIINTCKKYGWVSSIGGRKRRIDFKDVSFRDQWGSEREAVNFVIQGASADITKMAIKALKDEKILLQVHDELVIERGERSLEEIKAIMESVVSLRVPLIADAIACNNWSEGK